MAWYNDLWNSVSGQTDFKATRYDPESMTKTQQPWLNQLQRQASTDVVSPYQAGLVAEAAGSRGRDAGYDKIGDIGDAIDPNRASGQIEGVASRYGLDTLRQAAGIESLSSELATAPSAVDAMTTARMGQANSDALARAASTRGANAGLQMRETADANAAANRQLIGDAAAMKVKEMSDRYGQRGQLLRDAAGVTATGAATEGNLYGAAGQSNVTANQAKAGIQSDVMSGQRDESQLRQNAYTQGGNMGLQQQQGQTQASSAGLTGATQGQGIVAGSIDATNAANANVQSTNATNKGRSVGGIMAAAGGAAAMLSDVRAKEEIKPVGVTGSDDASRALRRYEVEQTPGSFDSWRSLVRDAAGAAPAAGQQDTFGLGGLGAGLSMLSDERSKTDVDPIVRMALDEDANRSELDDVRPYRYRYKASVADAIGADRAPREGVMAQDLERSGPAGREVVFDEPSGMKSLDLPKAVGYSLAANAGLDKRVQLLEEALGRSGRRAA